jgi:hypothetical protein
MTAAVVAPVRYRSDRSDGTVLSPENDVVV